MDMQLLVQRRDELDVDKVIEFIENCENAKVALVHASLKDDFVLLDFFESLIQNLTTSFAGVRVSGSATPKGYVENAIVVAVLCGDFDVDIFHEKINFNEPIETIEQITPKLNGWSLCLTYSATTCQQNVIMDFILRRINNIHPNLQILGGASSPPAFVATNDGMYDNHILCIPLKKIKTKFEIDSGFRFCKDNEKFMITKCNEINVFEINGKNAVDEYCKIQHIRPYFQNMLMKYALTKADIARIIKYLFKANALLYESGPRVGVTILGTYLTEDSVELFFVLELEEEKNYLLTQSYKPEGTELRRTETTKKDQIITYNNIHKRFSDADSLLVICCVALPLFFEFDFKSLEDTLKKIRCPFLLSFMFGEFGANLPYTGLEQNVVHGGVVKTLAFKQE